MINGAIMSIKQLSLVVAVSALTFTTATNAVLGPIPIYLNTEYRTSNPVIGSIASTITITSDDIASSGASTFNELLESIAGINFQQPHGNTPSLLLRGLKSKYTKIIIDGVELPSSLDAPLTDVIALNNIDRIEIIKSSASSLYGSGAIAGVVQVFTKTGAVSDVSMNFSSNNTKNIKYSYGSIDENSSINIGLSHYRTDGIDATGDGDVEGGEKKSGHFKIGYRNTTFSLIDSKYGYDYDNGDATIEFNQMQIKQDATFGGIKSTASYSQTLNKYVFNDALWGPSYTDFKVKSFKLKGEKNFNDALLNFGIDNSNKSAFGTYTSPEQELTETGIFAQLQKPINDIDTVVGFRHNRNSKFINVNTYSAGLGKQIRNHKLTFNYATAYKAPSLSNLYGNNGNDQLTAEQSKTIELGLKTNYQDYTTGVNLYNINIEDGIKYNEYVSPKYQNIPKIHSQGIDLTVNANLSTLDARFEYNYNKSREDGSDVQAIRIPKHTYNLKLTNSYKGFDSKVSFIHKSSSLDDTTYNGIGDTELTGYTLVNLGSSYNYDVDTKISLKVNNAFDKDYTVANGYNQLGRTVDLGVIYKF